MTRGYPVSSLVQYSTKGKVNAFAVPASKQVFLYNARAFNNSGGAINVGLLRNFVEDEFQLWQYVASGPTYTDITDAVTGATSTNIFNGANNDGFVLQSPNQFGLMGFTTSANGAGGTIVYKYWTGASFVTLTTLEVPANYSTNADRWIVFLPPPDWVVGGPAGVSPTQFSIFVQATTTPAAAVAINALWVGGWLELYQGVPNNAAIQMSFPDSKPFCLNGGEGIIPYFSTANAANQVGAYYVING
jgi:hypothetical protein